MYFGNAWAAPFAYVVNLDSNNVSVIDTASNTVTATVPVQNSGRLGALRE